MGKKGTGVWGLCFIFLGRLGVQGGWMDVRELYCECNLRLSPWGCGFGSTV